VTGPDRIFDKVTQDKEIIQIKITIIFNATPKTGNSTALSHYLGRLIMKKVILFNYLARPASKEFKKKYRGAYINCWVDSPDCEKAEVLAKRHIEKSGWKIIEEVEEPIFVDSNTYTYKEPEKKICYNLAVREGLFFACFAWTEEEETEEKRNGEKRAMMGK
jgi:hypothetical protein